ncbi:MAG TPA: hypothetical protein VNQ56_01435, partial [Pseudolabrys sp.]|nr:hypothetical protein [Pseudolabrys sp.]
MFDSGSGKHRLRKGRPVNDSSNVNRQTTGEIGSSVRGRIPYRSIYNRPQLRLPGDARVAVWTIVNVENWLPQAPMPRTVIPPPMGQPLLPD